MKGLLANFVRAFVYPRPLIGLLYLPGYFKQYFQYKHLDQNLKVEARDMYPCLLDATVTTPFDQHYFYQSAWLARRIKAAGPDSHMDVGSSVMMINVLSGFVDTLFVDYRPLDVALSGLKTVGANITSLPFSDNSVSSLSCQHVIEHIGLGRYGDPIDVDGTLNAARELERILQPGGKLYLSLPVGRERVCFNAHRVYRPDSVPGFFENLRLLDFSYVNDQGVFSENRPLNEVENDEYACGMYVFEKEI